MKDVEKLLKKIVKQSKDKDAKYFYGIEYALDSKKPVYKAYVSFSMNKVIPLAIMVNSQKDLVKGLQEYLDGADKKDVIIKYHQAEIAEAEKTVFWHQEKIKEYESISSELRTK